MKTRKELYDFGIELIQKGRRPYDIRSAINAQSATPKDKESVLEELFRIDTAPKKQSRQRIATTEILRENKKKINFEWSQHSLLRIPMMIIVLGIVVWVLGRPRVNDNAVFGIITFFTGIAIYIVLWLVKKYKMYQLLLIAFCLFFLFFSVELIVLGFPNDFLNGYNGTRMELGSRRLTVTTGGALARILAALMPFIYLALKLTFGVLLYMPYYHFRKYDELPTDIKNQIELLK